MDSSTSSDELIHDFPPFFKVYKDGHIERYLIWETVDAGVDPKTGVRSKDIVMVPETAVSARIFMPKSNGPDQKLPLFVHYHGGGFNRGSAFAVGTTKFLNLVASQANVMAISIEYRLAPEHPLPIAYEDSWAALQWIAAHFNGLGPEPWLNDHVDFGRVFLGGESAGANIAHYVAVEAGATGLVGVKVEGVIIVYPFFVGKERAEMYKFLSTTSSGCDDDPKINPGVDRNLKKMVGKRVLVCVAEKDWLKDRGVAYYETVSKSEWVGHTQLYETLQEDHCFHTKNPHSENAAPLIQKIIHFINQDRINI